MKPQQIQAVRRSLGESTAVFGQRFLRSGRTVEDWEQGRRSPDPLILRDLRALSANGKTLRKAKK